MCDIAVVIPKEPAVQCRAIHENRESAQRHREQTDPKTRSPGPLHRVAIVFREMGTLSRNDIRDQVLYSKGCAGLLADPATLGNSTAGGPGLYLLCQRGYVGCRCFVLHEFIKVATGLFGP